MTWNNEIFKTNGKMAMKRNYGAAVAVTLVMGIISALFGGGSGGSAGGSSASVENYGGEFYMDPEMAILMSVIAASAVVIGLIGMILTILVENVLKIGGYKFFILNQSGMQPGFEMVLDGFKSGHYKNLVLTMFLKDLFIGLWSLLLVIPGIIKSYEYRMVPYILAENPGMDRQQAFAISKAMMDGEKMNGFILDLSFIGWYLLSIFTCGILAVAYVNPYVEATWAEVYAYNKAKAYQQGFIR